MGREFSAPKKPSVYSNFSTSVPPKVSFAPLFPCPSYSGSKVFFSSIIYCIYRGIRRRSWSVLVSWSGGTAVCFSRDGFRLVPE